MIPTAARIYSWGRLVVLATSVLALSSWVLFGVTHAIDRGLFEAGIRFHGYLWDPDPNTCRYAFTSIAQSLAAIMAISMSLVMIAVQITANRYTHNIIDLFLRHKANLFILSAYTISILMATLVANSVDGEFAPQVGGLVSVILTSICLPALIPYLFFVFDFLKPDKIIDRIRAEAGSLMRQACYPQKQRNARALRGQVLARLEHIGDIAINSLRASDTSLVLASIGAIENIILTHQELRGRLPSEWNAIDAEEFIGFPRASLGRIIRDGTWFEIKGMEEFKRIFAESLLSIKDKETAMAIGESLREIVHRAIQADEPPIVEHTIKYLNTFLRHSLNARHPGKTYNLLLQYRLVAEETLGWRPEWAQRIAEHFVYYGLLAHALGVEFIPETIAYDLNMLIRAATSQPDGLWAERILDELGNLHESLRKRGSTRSLKGTRKMILGLAGHLCANGHTELADRLKPLALTMGSEEIISLRDHLLAVSDQLFWEMTDRVVNFDYLDEAEKRGLREFCDDLLAVLQSATSDQQSAKARPIEAGG